MTPALRALIAAVLCVLVPPLDAAAQDEPPRADKTLSPYFFVETEEAQLPLKDTRVEVAIAGVIADVTVHQVYENRGSRPIHARYVFPASTRAAVYGMTMTVGEVRTVATIKERQQAARQFEAAKREGKNASLLEQSRPNVFTMKLANVMPGDTVVVELKYTELLVPADGVYEFVYPTVVGPRYSEGGVLLQADRGTRDSEAAPGDDFVRAPYTRQGEAPRSEFHMTGVLTTPVPIQDLASPSHQLDVRAAGLRTEITLADSEQWSGNRDVVLRYRLAGAEIASGLLLYQVRRADLSGPPSQARDENFFLLMAQPPQAVQLDEVPPREYIFVVDVSGSMNGFPLDTAKKLMGDLAAVLRSSDAFNVVVFADGSARLAPASVPATRPNLTRALQFIGQKRGGGGTRLLNALKDAVAIQRQPGVSRSVVLITDGYIDAEAAVFDFIREQRDDLNFFAFGIGSSVNRFLIEGVAKAGLGEPFVVTQPEESAEAAARLRRYIDTPILTGIDVRFTGFDIYDVEPRTIPDMFASRPIVVIGKWRGAAAGSIEISGKTGRGPYRTSIPVSTVNADAGHRALRQLWARTRIADLSDFGPSTPDEDRVAAITSLGLTYSLLTRYTSFVAVQELVRRTSEDAVDVDQPLPLPAGVSDLAVGVTSGSEPDIMWLAAILVASLVCVSGMRRRRQAPATSL